MKPTALLAAVAFTASASFNPFAAAAPGDLDFTFGNGGITFTEIGGGSARSLAIRNDGGIVVAGNSNAGANSAFAVVRYQPNGSLDASFNGTGKVTTDIGVGAAYSYGVAIQMDGKIVVAGNFLRTGAGTDADIAVVRYNTDGSLDTSFNATGKVTTAIGSSTDNARSVVIQNDGKILVVGWSLSASNKYDFALVRYNANGSLDTSFNGTGKVTTAVGSGHDYGNSVVVQADEKLVVAGYSHAGTATRFALVRYNSNGSLDTTFNGTGKVTTNLSGNGRDEGNSLVLQNDGRIVVAGTSGSNFGLVRYNADGSLDTTFNGTGKVITDLGGSSDVGNSVVLQSDEKIVVAGHSDSAGNGAQFAVVRYNPNGSLDTSFGSAGKVTTPSTYLGYCVALQNVAKIVVAGLSYNGNFAVARYEGSSLIVSGAQTVNLGAAVTFSVTALGISPLSYQWKKDGVEIPGATGSSYTIANAQPWHIGDYTVVATVAGGTLTTDAALLQINGVPTAVWRGLVVFYPFDGNAQDREVGGANATVSGAVLTADRFRQPNRAFDFDGINNQMTATVPNLPVGNAPRTLSLWAKARPDPSRGVGLVEWGLAQNGKAFGIANSGSPYNWNGKTYGAANGVNSGLLVDSKWHHLCLTYDGGILAIYVDGVLKQTKSEAINTGQSALTMGVGVEGSTFYPGNLDEVRIYNRALSPSEVQQLNTTEDPDTDGDGIRDQFETGTGIYVSPEDTGTSATNPDSDGDGLNDGEEVNGYHTNPTAADTDGDGWDDGFEVSTGFSPTSAASSPDSLSSIRTAAEYRFHAAPGISYRIEASTDLANWTTIETNIIGAGGAVTRFYSIEGQTKRYFRSRRN